MKWHNSVISAREKDSTSYVTVMVVASDYVFCQNVVSVCIKFEDEKYKH